MVFDIEWLKGAQDELDAEIEYVFNEFGFHAAKKAYLRTMEHVNLLASFPRIGAIYPDVTYLGFEVRKLIIHQLTLFYSPQADRITILAVWNNYQDSERIASRLKDVDS